jgi:hypothetical protein
MNSEVGRMPDSFDRNIWLGSFRDGLIRARDAVWARDHESAEAERRALRAVAAHPAFAELGPAADAVPRGKWLTTRIVRAVTALLADLPPTASVDSGRAADKAVFLWARTSLSASSRAAAPCPARGEPADAVRARG